MNFAVAVRARLCTPAACVGVLFALLSVGCGHYSFTGASIPEHIGTVAIPLTEDATSNPIPDLGGLLTERLVQRFVRQTRLELATDETRADAVLGTEIRQYSVRPAAVGGENRAALNQLSITVSARYSDRVEEREVFQRSFSASFEYDPADFTGEEEAANEALDDIADDIFQAATSNW